jgi:hypothetical protein
MNGETLVHELIIDIQGDTYEIRVYCDDNGRHIAKTHFSEHDIIINDAPSLQEVLVKHESLLPLAISSRQMLRKSSYFPKKGINRF